LNLRKGVTSDITTMKINPDRFAKIQNLAARRQPDLTVVLENVHDPHNIGAVLRTCDSVGIKEIYVLYTDPDLARHFIAVGKRTSAGSRKWVDVHLFTHAETCFDLVKQRYGNLWATHLATDSCSLYDLTLSESAALLFGNEQYGLSEMALSYSSGNFVIPQMGMAQSLNISVACAVSLYEAYRQRQVKGYYDHHPGMPETARAALLEDYLARHATQESMRIFRHEEVQGGK